MDRSWRMGGEASPELNFRVAGGNRGSGESARNPPSALPRVRLVRFDSRLRLLLGVVVYGRPLLSVVVPEKGACTSLSSSPAVADAARSAAGEGGRGRGRLDADGGAATGASTTGLLPLDFLLLEAELPIELLKLLGQSREGVAAVSGGAAVNVGKALGRMRGISRGGKRGTPATTSMSAAIECALFFKPSGLLKSLLVLLLLLRCLLPLEGSGADAARDTSWDLTGDSVAVFAVVAVVVTGWVRPESVRSSSSSAHRSNICSRAPTDRRKESAGCAIGLST